MRASATASVRVGDYDLEVGSRSGSFAAFAAGSSTAASAAARPNEAALREALAEPDDRRWMRASLERLEALETSAERVTERVEHAHVLFRAAAEDRLLDPRLLAGEIGGLLDLLARLDRDGRYEEEIRVAKALRGLCLIAFRWLDLVRSLRSALAAAAALGDRAGRAWALNELGALHLCAGDATQAGAYLDQALGLQQELGDTAGRCATRHNRDCARRDTTPAVHGGGPRPPGRPRLVRRLAVVGGIASVAAALVGGMAIGQARADRGGDEPDDDAGALVVSIGERPPKNSPRAAAGFSFSAENAEGFECRLDDERFRPCSSPMEYRDLDEDRHTFRVKAVGAGRQGSTARYVWRIDLTSPTTAITAGPPSRSTGTSAELEFEADEAVQGFECRLGREPFAACSSPESLAGLLADRRHAFVVRAIDLAGNVGAPVTYTWTVASTAGPVAEIVRGPGTPTNETSALFAFRAPEAARFECRLDRGPFAPCTSPWPVPGLTDDIHTFEVRALNAAGTPGDAAPWTWTVDTAPPIATIDRKQSTSSRLVFGADDPASSFECLLRDVQGDFAPCASPWSVAWLEQGEYRFAVRAVDEAGNDGPADELTFKVSAPSSGLH